MKADRPPCWRATVSIKRKDGGAREKVIEGTALSECPVSFITPESIALVDLVRSSKLAHNVAGAPLFGTDSSKWPAWWIDAVSICEVAIASETELRTELNARK